MQIFKKILWAMSVFIVLIAYSQALHNLIADKTFLGQALIQTGAVAVWCIFLLLNPNNN